LLTALLAALVSARAAVAASGIIGLVGTWGMTATPAVDAREESGTQRHRGSAVRVAALRRCMLTLGLMVLALNCIELGVIAAVSHGKAASTFAGVVIALWSVGSIAGGLWYGAHRGRQRPAAAHVFPVAAAFAVLIAAPNVPVLVILLVAGGTTVAPMFGRMYAEVSAVSPPSVITEAYSWIGVGNLTGAAIGSPLGGYLISATSPRIAFVAGTAAVTLAGLAAIGLRPLPIPELSAHVEPAVRTGP
jgi:hypothetical protein